MAGSEARFGITPAKLGIVYSLHDTKLLVDLVGPAQAKRILFTARLIDAAEAHRIGLVDFLSDDPAATLTELCEAIAAASPHSIAGTKRNIAHILAGQADDDDATLAEFPLRLSGARITRRA